MNALLALGFKLETIADLIRSEFATIRIESVENRDSKSERALVHIADASWRTLEGLTPRRRVATFPQRRVSGFRLRNTAAAAGVGLLRGVEL